MADIVADIDPVIETEIIESSKPDFRISGKEFMDFCGSGRDSIASASGAPAHAAAATAEATYARHSDPPVIQPVQLLSLLFFIVYKYLLCVSSIHIKPEHDKLEDDSDSTTDCVSVSISVLYADRELELDSDEVLDCETQHGPPAMASSLLLL